MSLKQALIELKERIKRGGEHSIQTYKGLLSEDELEQFKLSNDQQRKELIAEWKESGKLTDLNKISIFWREILIRKRDFSKLYLILKKEL